MTKPRRWKWFSEEEVIGLDLRLVTMLDRARELAGVLFVITSGARTLSENARVGGVSGSEHCDVPATACDLRARDSHTRFRIVEGLIAAGFKRIGIYRSHVHAGADSDPHSRPNEVMWIGEGD